MVAFFVPSPHYVVPTKMIDVIKHLGLETSLQLCLDAGDLTSYDGTSQTWTDATGNGNNFYRGDGSGSAADDPTFTGVAGRQSGSEYFLSDGADAFWNTAKHTFPASWHKDNATFTLAAWAYLVPHAASEAVPLFANFYDTTQRGVGVAVQSLASTGRPTVQMARGDAGPSVQLLSPTATDFIVENAWMLVGVSFSEGSGQSFGFANATASVFSSDTYTSPSASDPDFGGAIWSTPNSGGTGHDTDPAFIVDSGTRLNSLMAWNRALSQAEISSLYTATKTKFGL